MKKMKLINFGSSFSNRSNLKRKIAKSRENPHKDINETNPPLFKIIYSIKEKIKT